ncbi:MAG: hypothetical protein IPJ30_05350 [Acidobacteria bacterium]|nr:hypothetical protein [Acidobacteriota bacterium]
MNVSVAFRDCTKFQRFQIPSITDSGVRIPDSRFQAFQAPKIPDSRFQRFQIPNIPNIPYSRFKIQNPGNPWNPWNS